MTSPTRPATRDAAKRRAVELRNELKMQGTAISHAQALERVAAGLGFRDWNTASARLPSHLPQVLQIGDRVAGRYLKQPFAGKILAVRELGGGQGYDVTVHFDAPVDVVAFDSFSSYRQRVKGTVSRDGISWAKTSDGEPHLVVARQEA